MNSAKRLGILNHWNGDKGYGFVRYAVEDFNGRIVRINDRDLDDTFLHISQVQRAGIDDIAVGDILLFDVTIDSRKMKPQASNIDRPFLLPARAYSSFARGTARHCRVLSAVALPPVSLDVVLAATLSAIL
jgi:cold shock CspA family protein